MRHTGSRCQEELSAQWATVDGILAWPGRSEAERVGRCPVALVPVALVSAPFTRGYPPVGQLLDAGPTALQALPGVGTQTAARALGAARQLAATVADGMHVRVDLEPGDERGTAPLTAIRRYKATELATAPVREAAASN